MVSDKLFRFATRHQPWDNSSVSNYSTILYILFPNPTDNFPYMERNEDGIDSWELKIDSHKIDAVFNSLWKYPAFSFFLIFTSDFILKCCTFLRNQIAAGTF